MGKAETWRRQVAHDYKHMDLAQTSLVSRVCNQADGLIVSNEQANLIGRINAYLGLSGSVDFTNEEGLRPGILLCMLCILLCLGGGCLAVVKAPRWCLYLCNEFRMPLGRHLGLLLDVFRGRGMGEKQIGPVKSELEDGCGAEMARSWPKERSAKDLYLLGGRFAGPSHLAHRV